MKNKKTGILVIGIGIIVIAIGILLFISVGNRADNNEVACIDIETPYVELAFPKEWSEDVHIETIEKEDGKYIIEFYGTVNEEESVHLVDITFGGEEGTHIGNLTFKDEKNPIALNIIYYNVDDVKKWSDDEIIKIQDMISAIEYSVDSIVEMENFKLVN